MAARIKLLFITKLINSEEYGQASVHITVISTLLKQYSDEVDIHLCSFGKLATRCPEGATFHQLNGTGLTELGNGNWAKRNPGVRPPTGTRQGQKPGLVGSIRSSIAFREMLFPWSDTGYLQIVAQVVGIISDLEPDLVILDPIMAAGIDACHKLGVRAITLSPVSWSFTVRTVADTVNMKRFLSWPSMSNGSPYPLAWSAYPSNILQIIFAFLFLLLSPSLCRLNYLRWRAGLPFINPMLNAPKPVICPGTMALDYHGDATPDVVPVGPLLPAYKSADLFEADPELAAWLDHGDQGQGKTILIALGSHFKFDATEVRAMLRALEVVLACRQDVRVLWKLIPDVAHADAQEDIRVLADKTEGRLRVTEWLRVSPQVLLQSGYVGAFVNHGGGNSFHEAIGTGVPQVIIAGWLDCYSFAQRAVDLGIGIWANRNEAPSIAVEPLTSALLAVTGTTPRNSTAIAYKRRAHEAMRTSRNADTMPSRPGNRGAGGEEEKLQVVQIARKQAVLGQDGEGAAYVNGRDVAAEWIYRYARAAP